MTKIYLTHSPDALKNYYGERALAELRALGEVKLNPLDRPLSLDELIREAQGQELSWRAAILPRPLRYSTNCLN